MFQKSLLLAVLAIALNAGDSTTPWREIQATLGSNDRYTAGVDLYLPSASVSFDYKQIDKKDAFTGIVYPSLTSCTYFDTGVGVIHTKAKNSTTKPVVAIRPDAEFLFGRALGNLVLNTYIADANNMGIGGEWVIFYKGLYSEDRISDAQGFVKASIGFSVDKVQGETEKSVFLRLGYQF